MIAELIEQALCIAVAVIGWPASGILLYWMVCDADDFANRHNNNA